MAYRSLLLLNRALYVQRPLRRPLRRKFLATTLWFVAGCRPLAGDGLVQEAGSDQGDQERQLRVRGYRRSSENVFS